MSEEHHDIDKVTAQVEAELQRWADSHIVGKEPLNEDTLAEFERATEMMIDNLLRERGLEGFHGRVVDARIDPDHGGIITAGVRIEPRGAE